MSSLNQIYRLVIAALCGVSCLVSTSGMTAGALAALMQGDHDVATLEHDGHRDLILLHRDAAQAESCAHHNEHLEAQPGHHHENHTFHLAAKDYACVLSAPAMQAPAVVALTSMIPEFAFPNQGLWQSKRFHARPPPCLDGVIVCLRTTVLVV